jgi:hypothetical protein
LFISLAHSQKTSIIFPELSVSCNVIQMWKSKRFASYHVQLLAW